MKEHIYHGGELSEPVPAFEWVNYAGKNQYEIRGFDLHESLMLGGDFSDVTVRVYSRLLSDDSESAYAPGEYCVKVFVGDQTDCTVASVIVCLDVVDLASLIRQLNPLIQAAREQGAHEFELHHLACHYQELTDEPIFYDACIHCLRSKRS